MDFGASFHVTHEGICFLPIQVVIFWSCEDMSYNKFKILGKEDVFLKTNTGCQLMLKDERHVLDVRIVTP